MAIGRSGHAHSPAALLTDPAAPRRSNRWEAKADVAMDDAGTLADRLNGRPATPLARPRPVVQKDWRLLDALVGEARRSNPESAKNPSPACRRRWRAAPDERLRAAFRCADRPSPQPLSRKQERGYPQF
jgi:hypothetical protein